MPGWEVGIYLDGNREPPEVLKIAVCQDFLLPLPWTVVFPRKQWSSSTLYTRILRNTELTPLLQTALVFHHLCPFVYIVPLRAPPKPTQEAFKVLLCYLPHEPTSASLRKTYFSPGSPQRKREKMFGVGRKKTNLPQYLLHVGHYARCLHLLYSL